MSSASLIELRRVSCAYGRTVVLKSIDLGIPAGSMTLVYGPNGAGKSSLGRLLLGLLPPAEGSIDNRAKRLAYVPQRRQLDSQYPLSLRELVLTGLRPRTLHEAIRDWFRFDEREVKEYQLEALLERVGLLHDQELLFREASGGQLQRALIARGLIDKPDFVILDEPFSHLDVDGRREIAELLKEINYHRKITMVVIDHSADVPETIYDQRIEVIHGAVRVQ